MSDYGARVAGTQAEMIRQGVDLLFLSPSPDLAYLTGFRLVPFSSAMMYNEMWLPESWLLGA
jgi:Xaa-Pro aminopeptidase